MSSPPTEGGPVSIIYPMALGGISEQPAHLRYDNQAEDAANAVFSVDDGVSKRPPTLYLSMIDAGKPVSFSGADWTVSTKTITKTGAFASYTYADGHYIYIRLTSPDIRWGLYKIAGKTSDNAITLTESIADADQTGIITTGWPTDGNIRMHKIERDETEKYIVLYGMGQVRVFDLLGNEQIVRTTTPAVRYLLNWKDDVEAGTTGADADDMVMATSHDYTLIANRGLIPKARAANDYAFTEKADIQTMFNGVGGYSDGDRFYAQEGGRGLPSGFYRYSPGDDTYAKLFCRSVGPGWADFARYNNAGALSFGIDFIEPDETEWNVRIASLTITAAASMNDVASQFGTALTNALQALTSGSEVVTVAWVPATNNRGRFVITSPFIGAGSQIAGVFPYEDGNHWANKWPFSKTQATDGSGTSGGTLTLAEQFERIRVPGQLGAVPGPYTLPMAMIRYSIGEYNEAGTVYYPGEWELDANEWTPRKSGSAQSNPAPSFFQAPGQAGKDQEGKPIQDLTFHAGRLVIGAGDRIYMSQADDLFNFYLDDATDIFDADPIEIPVSSNQVATIRHITPFRKTLLFDTKAGAQFELLAVETLTPTSAQIVATTAYRTIELRPVEIGDMLYFASARKDAAVLYEYYYDDTRVNNFANDVTAHYRNRIPSDIRSIIASQNNQMVFVVPSDCDQMHVYAAWWLGNQKVQSAWTRWQFDDSYRIIDGVCIDNDLYLLIESGSTLFFEKMPLTRQIA